MITIPEYVYNDNTIEFVCPALELTRKDAEWMRAVLTNPKWQDVLDELGYICTAFRALGLDSKVVWHALIKRYNRVYLEDCIYLTLARDVSAMELKYIANMVRKA